MNLNDITTPAELLKANEVTPLTTEDIIAKVIDDCGNGEDGGPERLLRVATGLVRFLHGYHQSVVEDHIEDGTGNRKSLLAWAVDMEGLRQAHNLLNNID